MKERNILIDVAKGLGILLVIWRHTACPFLDEISSFRLHFFFMLSGYFFSRKDLFKDQLYYNIKRIGRPYLLFSVLIYLYYLLFCFIFKLDYDPLIIIKTIPYDGVVSEPLWFLVSLFTISVFYYFVSKIKNSYIQLLLCLILFIVSKLHLLPIPYRCFYISSSMSFLIYYFIGNKLREFHANIFTLFAELKSYNKLLYTILSLSAFCILYYAIDFAENKYLSIAFSIPIALLGICCLVSFASLVSNLKKVSSGLAYIGRNSLTMYAIQLPLMELTRPVSNLFFERETYLWGGMNVFVNLFITIIATEILCRVFPGILGKNRKIKTQ
jgi:Fucose 4-O-acetylase and related acetyltransferases